MPDSPCYFPPRAHVPGFVWPTIASEQDNIVLALQFQLEQTQWLSAESIEAMQLQQLQSLVDSATRNVPFYRKSLLPLLGGPGNVLTFETFRHFPLLTRSDIQDAGNRLHSKVVPEGHGDIHMVQTSGSTGQPVRVNRTTLSILFSRALTLRNHRWHQRDFNATVAGILALRGRSVKAARQGHPTRWIPAHDTGSYYHFDVTRPVGEQLDWLIERDPAILVTYPSNLRALLERSKADGRRPRQLGEVTTMGEPVYPKLRQLCAEEWHARLIDSYSSQEFGMMAVQCPQHSHYHIQAEGVVLEVLDADGHLCKPGEIGRIVVTDLHNFSMPLIRYALGDYARVGQPCSCGRGLPVLDEIIGRERNMLHLPSGDTAWPVPFFSRELLDIAPVRQIQIIQETLHAINVKLAVERGLTEAEATALKTLIGRRLGDVFDITLTCVDEIPLSRGGKFQDFISNIE
jgi:phenylacetate-CoA ligase